MSLPIDFVSGAIWTVLSAAPDLCQGVRYCMGFCLLHQSLQNSEDFKPSFEPLLREGMQPALSPGLTVGFARVSRGLSSSLSLSSITGAF